MTYCTTVLQYYPFPSTFCRHDLVVGFRCIRCSCRKYYRSQARTQLVGPQHLAALPRRPGSSSAKPGPCARPLSLISHGPLGTSASRWEHWSEEAYEGWGWGGAGVVANDAGASVSASAAAADVGRGNSTFGGMFRRPGVVFPIHPTGHMRLPRPKLPFKQDSTGGDEGRVTFVVQVRALSVTRGAYCFAKVCPVGYAPKVCWEYSGFRCPLPSTPLLSSLCRRRVIRDAFSRCSFPVLSSPRHLVLEVLSSMGCCWSGAFV